MINKMEVGSRIAALRKRQDLSQALLADKLNVTPQAISKWETGLALPDVELLLALSRIFKVTINEIIEGNNVLRKIAKRFFEMDDIAYFVPREERDYNVEWAKGIVEGNWTKRNWEWHKANLSTRKEIAKRILSYSGLILEIGTGPGGIYVSGDGYVTQETLGSYPEYIQKILLEKRPDIFEDFYDATVTTGFKTIDNTISYGWPTKNDESAVADLARELGIEIIFSGYLRYCKK